MTDIETIQRSHDPGGKVRLPMLEGVFGGAYITQDGQYRHFLWRSWEGKDAPPKKFWLFIGANPSTAEAYIDDPTIRKEVAFTRRHDGPGYFKCNVMDFRATHPEDLLKISNACSIFNVPNILKHAENAEKIVVAWGALHKSLQIHADQTLQALRNKKYDLYCFGKTKDGHPKHTLYLRNDTPLEKF